MRISLSLASLALAFVSSVSAQAPVPTVAGVTLPPTADVAGTTLHLNGVALRKKAIVKVYVAGLYLPAKASDGAAILAADEPRRLVMQFVRDVDAGKMCDAWDDSLKKNTPDASDELKAQFKQLCGWMEDLKKGDVMTFTYEPATGTTVDVKGQVKGTVPGKEFGDALFKSWIGPKPGPGEGFKKDLLGLK